MIDGVCAPSVAESCVTLAGTLNATCLAQCTKKALDGARNMITPNQFLDGCDSDRIHAAIAQAETSGARCVEIPRVNRRTQRAVWQIDRAILLPSDFTLILRDCRIELEIGVHLAHWLRL